MESKEDFAESAASNTFESSNSNQLGDTHVRDTKPDTNSEEIASSKSISESAAAQNDIPCSTLDGLKRTDGKDSDSECEHFEDAIEGLELNSSRTAECGEQIRISKNDINGEDEFTESLTDHFESKPTSDCEESVIDEEVLRDRESRLTDEDRLKRCTESRRLKDLGNDRFKEGRYEDAIECYSDALMSCLLSKADDRAIIYSNRAAAYMKLEKFEDAIKDSCKALEYNPDYMKALLRRAELYERVDKLDEALEDYKKALDRDPSLHQARAACMRLPGQINERNEKLKTEMIGKLKDLGNLILRPFGLSTANFNLQQDPSTGSYSVNFKQ